jgi:hypothetical protein
MKGFPLEILNLPQPAIDWLTVTKGIPPENLIKPSPVMACKGHCAEDLRFDPDPIEGKNCFTFEEENDRVFWHPATGKLATWEGRGFCLGESLIYNPATTAFGHALNVFSSPARWLKKGRDGICVVNWDRAFDILRYVCGNIIVEEPVFALYQRHMKPAHMPKVFVLTLRFGGLSRFGQGPIETLSGPGISSATDLYNIWQDLRQGDPNAGRLLDLAINNTPYINLFYSRTALDILWFNSWREWARPGYLHRQENNLRKTRGQKYLRILGDRKAFS